MVPWLLIARSGETYASFEPVSVVKLEINQMQCTNLKHNESHYLLSLIPVLSYYDAEICLFSPCLLLLDWKIDAEVLADLLHCMVVSPLSLM